MLQYRTNWGERRKPKIGQFGELTVEQARSIAQDRLAARMRRDSIFPVSNSAQLQRIAPASRSASSALPSLHFLEDDIFVAVPLVGQAVFVFLNLFRHQQILPSQADRCSSAL